MKLGKVVRLLHLSHNMVIVVKEGSELAKRETIDELSKAISDAGYHNIILLVSDDLNNVKMMDDAEMFKQGWVRLDKVRKLITNRPHIIPEEEPEPEPHHEQ